MNAFSVEVTVEGFYANTPLLAMPVGRSRQCLEETGDAKLVDSYWMQREQPAMLSGKSA